MMRLSALSKCAAAAALLFVTPVAGQDVVPAPRPAPTHPLTLPEVIALAQENGLTAQAAENARDAARFRDRAFSSRLLPRLSLDGRVPSYNKSITPVIQPDGSTIYLPLGEAQSSMNLTLAQPIPILGAQAFVRSGATRIRRLSGAFNSYWQSTPLVFGFQQELFKPRQYLWEKRESDIRADLAEAQFLEAREDVAARAAGAYFDLYAAQVAEANAINNAAVNDSLYIISKGRYEVGKIGENDLLQSELAVLRARASVDAAKLESERALAALRLELNLEVGAALSIAPPPPAIRMVVDADLAVAEAKKNRSARNDVELQRVQARRRVAEARYGNSFGATLTAQMGYNQTAPLFEDAFRTPLQQRRLELQVGMPLFQWGAGRADVRGARSEQARIGNLAERTEREVEHEAYFSARSYGQAQRQLEISAKADTVATRRFNSAKDRYVIGRIAIDNLYIAQNEKDAALLAYVQAVRGYWLSYYRLRRLTLYDFERARRID
jgi:outer membrane protein TolC